MPSLLLITAHLAPSQAVGGRRAERMARHLTALGWQVTVLAPHPQYSPPVDAGLQPPEGCEILRTHAWMPLVLGRQLRDRVRPRRPAAAPAPSPVAAPVSPPAGGTPPQPAPWLRRLREHLIFPDEFAGWGPLLERAVTGRRFDAVLVTAPPHSICVAAARVARKLGAPLVLDYRDPWAEVHAAGPLAARHRSAEDALLAQAALVIGVTPTICRWLAARTAAPVVFVPNAVEAQPARLTPGPRASLAYTGSLAYGRSLAAVLAALRPLEGAQLVYAGAEGRLVQAEAQALDAAAWLDNRGPVSKREATALVQEARAGIVTVNPPLLYPYPGKIFDILGLGRPILLVGPLDCDAAVLVREHQLGWTVDPADTGGLRRAVAEAIGGREFSPTGLQALTAASTMGRLDAALRQVAGH